MFVDSRFASDKRKRRIFVHKVEDGSASGDAFIKAFAPIPKPNRVEMRVCNQVKSLLSHDGGFPIAAETPAQLEGIWTKCPMPLAVVFKCDVERAIILHAYKPGNRSTIPIS
jgi:hypothetical protein